MKKLEINITKATLQSFTIEARDGKPEVQVTLALLTEGGKAITTYSVGTDEWRGDKLDLPMSALPLIGDLARLLERAAVNHCRDSQLVLGAGTPPAKKQPVTVKDDVVIEDIGDQPINLDDIPF